MTGACGDAGTPTFMMNTRTEKEAMARKSMLTWHIESHSLTSRCSAMALVTDVLIIKRGDAPPPGYILVDRTVGGKSVPFRAAPLIGGIALALAVRRSDDPFVVSDIKIVDTGSEAVPQGFDMIARTPGGCECRLCR